MVGTGPASARLGLPRSRLRFHHGRNEARNRRRFADPYTPIRGAPEEVRGQRMQSELLREPWRPRPTTRTAIGDRTNLVQPADPRRTSRRILRAAAMQIELDAGTAPIPWNCSTRTRAIPASSPGPSAPLLRKRTARFREHAIDADGDASAPWLGNLSVPRISPALRAGRPTLRTCLQQPDALGESSLRRSSARGVPGRPGTQGRWSTLFERPWRIVHIAGHGKPGARRTRRCRPSNGFSGTRRNPQHARGARTGLREPLPPGQRRCRSTINCNRASFASGVAEP